MPLRQYLLPHRLREILSCCPASFTTYATLHLDSIGKIVNHLLATLLVCNIFFFFASWNAITAPLINVNLVLSSFLLLVQTCLVYMIVNNSHPTLLPPTDFILGIALGITVGGSILSFIVSSAFAHPPTWICHSMQPIPGNSTSSSTTTMIPQQLQDYCTYQGGNTTTLWLWSSLVFWLNFCNALLLAIGRRDLSLGFGSANPNYERIGEYDDPNVIDPNGGAGFSGQGGVGSAPRPAFVGDYAQIPEIRSHPPEQAPLSTSTTSSSSSVSGGGGGVSRKSSSGRSKGGNTTAATESASEKSHIVLSI